MQAKILSVDKERLQEDGSDFLSVTYRIVDGKHKITRREGFPFDTPTKEIEKLVQAQLELYSSEKERGAKNEKVDALQAKADQTIKTLEGKTFSAK
ncbi:MAG: hypothetical protein M3362_00285 [Acidobacteriota bacterium]|nr:hypothetical protein [Acidobacteriota bacterium]